MMLSDKGIREMLYPSNDARPAVFVPSSRVPRFGFIKDRQIQPASLDVRVAEEFIRHPSGDVVIVPVGAAYSMAPGECLLGCLVERLRLNADNVVARIEGKSSWARRFLTVHSAGFIDPGFTGDVTLELKNDGHSRLEIVPGATIAQISFQFLAAPAERLYGHPDLNSHFQGQLGPRDAS